LPEEVIVPLAELPLATLLTDQVTAVLVVPVTEAANFWELPARTLTGFGVTETWISPDAGGFGGAVGGVDEPETRPQPACRHASKERRINKLRRTDMPPKETCPE
jgi:hypothetical protein